MSAKVYAGGDTGGPKDAATLASSGLSTAKWGPTLASLHQKHTQSRPWRRLYKRWERFYKQLSFKTRATIHVGINLCVVLYNFFTVPFRIAFYYDPVGATHQHQWTTELTVYVIMDFIVDAIALFEFLRVYQSRRGCVRRFSSIASRITAWRRNSLVQPTQLSRLPTKRLQHEEAKWTLTSLERTLNFDGMTARKETKLGDFDRKRNLKFLLELVTLVPVEVLPYATGTYNALHLVRITKLCHLYRLQSCLEYIMNIYSDRSWIQLISSVGIKSLVRTIILCMGLCHYFACGYMLIAHIQCGIAFQACEPRNETSWAIRDRLAGATVARKYARTLYWASRTVMLLGFDELAPVANADTIYVIFVTVIGAFFVSSLLASFLFIFRFWNARDAAFAAHVDNAREYMRSQNIPPPIRRQVIEYFNYTWKTHQSLDSDEALQMMPKHFQLKVVSTIKASRIMQVCFLVKECVEFINLLAPALNRRVYSPTDPIISTKLNTQMFFIIRGRVIISDFNGTDSKECQTGDFFAETCLLFPEKFEEKAVAKTFCELYVLAKVKFDEAMVDFYREAEADVRDRMEEILDKNLTQQRKTKKLLGVRGKLGNGCQERNTNGVIIDETTSSRRISWKIPGSVFRNYWDAVRLLSLLYVAFEVPYFAVFVSKAQDHHILVDQQEFGFRYYLMLLTELFFGVNIILRSRFLAHVDPVVMMSVDDPELIFEAYKADGLYFDLLAWLPVGIALETLATTSRQNYAMLFRFLRLLRLREVPDLLTNVCDFSSASSKTHLVISLLLGISFLLHIVGCVWFEMAWIPIGDVSANAIERWSLSRPQCLHQAALFSNCSWVIFDCYSHIGIEFPVENPESAYQAEFAYLRSMYWAIVTLTTVGYGDITAFSTGESYFAAFWIFVGGIINFATVGAMSSTISNVMAPHRQHVEKLNQLSSTLEQMDISGLLRDEIRQFYYLEFTGRKQAYESQLLSNLPDRLCYEISSLLHSEAVRSIELFDSASHEFIREVTGKFRHQNYQNGDTICLEGDICREFLVLLRGSKVNVFFRSRKVPIRGDCYGLNEFLLGCAHPATLIAASLVHASVMTRDQFENIQRKFDDDLKDIKEEAQTLLVEQHKCMRRIMRNFEKLKLQTHLMTTSTLFYQGELAVTAQNNNNLWTRNQGTVVRAAHARRNMLVALWNAFITCWNIYNAIFVIFRVCFHSHLHFSSSRSTAVWIADLICDVSYAADIYLHLYYFGNSEIRIENLVDRKEIDQQYLRSSILKWNVVASLPLYTPFSSGALPASLCRLPRLIRCIDLWTYLDDLIVQVQQHFASHNVSAYLSPVKLMIILVLVAHYVGCVFFGISERECKHVERCWIHHDKVLHEHNYSLSMMYAKSFYWAITTMLLAGSREIVPRDTAATLWTGFTCLCCTFIIGHIVGEISDLFQELSKDAKHYKSRLASFDSFANEHELPELLVKRVGFFFREQYKHAVRGDIHDTVHDLSANLRLKLMIEVYGSSISLLPIGRHLTSSQIHNLALRLKSELFIPGDNILVEGTFGSRLCILRKGLAAAFWTDSVTSLAVLMEGALFGEVAFFMSGQKRLATVRATTSCEVLHVNKHDWEELWASNGDLSDAQVQRHAQHAILEWIQGRLQRYRRFALDTVNKIMRLQAARRRIEATATAAKGTARAKKRLSAVLLSRKGNAEGSFSSASALPVVIPALKFIPESTGPIDGTATSLLKKKAEYLHAKTNDCILRFYPTISALYPVRRQSSMSTQSTRSSISRRSDSNGFRDLYRSMVGDSITPVARSSMSDIHVLQFMVEVNPINKKLHNCLTNEHLCTLEAECWTQFRLLVAAEFGVIQQLESKVPPETLIIRTVADISGTPTELSFVKIRDARNKFIRTRSVRHDEHTNRRQNLKQLAMSGNRRSSMVYAQSAVATPRSAQREGLNTRRVSMVASRLPPPCIDKSYENSATNKHRLRGRSKSLPHFDHKFFEELRRNEGKRIVTKNTQTGLDFGMLQCFHPRKPVELTHWYRNRAHRIKSAEPTYNFHLRDTFLHAKIVAVNNLEAAPRGVYWQSLCAIVGNFQSKTWRKVSKQVGKTWNLVMLLASLYHLLVTTFKVCFSTDLAYLPVSVLRSWSTFEFLLDLICVLDVVAKLSYKYFTRQGAIVGDRQSISRRVATNEPALYADIFAMLPLELLLFISKVRVPVSYMPSSTGAADASWWTTRWLLRVNRLLLIRWVGPLFEKVLQHMIDKEKVWTNEALLYFVQGFATYLTMGHLLACIWFFTSNLGRLFYEVNQVTTIEHTARVLGESSDVADVSLVNKYLRALLFSMECISTLFYGDILSMNPVEAVTELGITVWSIYVYGALVGAQGELFDSRARREAAFEQILSQLQRYLVQNEVPQGIKCQVKAYYARLWHCRKGEAEFKPIEQVSRVLYEDVVLATVCNFVVQVKVFESLDGHFLRALLVCLQHVVCSANEEICVVGDMDRSMYFIAQGRVSVKIASSESTLERGEFFGELALLYSIARLETCVTLTMSELYRLDHEPYERVLLEFPEYRVRNKQAWTTVSSAPFQCHSSAVEALKNFRPPHSEGNPPLPKLAMNAECIQKQVLHSFIYRSTMELLSKLSKVDPQEAKDLVLKGRDGAQRHLHKALGVAASHRNCEVDEVLSFHSPSPAVTSREESDPEKPENNEQLEVVAGESLKPPESARSMTTKRPITLLRRQTDSAIPQLRRWGSSTIDTQVYSDFADPVLNPTAIEE